MANRLTGIDHVLIAVADLAAAAGTWRRLGFTPTPRGSHPEWGTANHCLMFRDSYVELIAGLPAQRGGVAEGVAGLALATPDAAAAVTSLTAAGVAAQPAQGLSRLLEAEDGTVTPRFSIARLPDDALPLPSFLCQHLTPELLRRPDWLEHANGAIGLASLTIAADEPESLRPALERVFGPASTTATDSTVAVHTGGPLILLSRPEDLDQLHPDLEIDSAVTLPKVVVLTVTVRDTAAAAALLTANGIPFDRDHSGTLRVASEDAHGVAVEMVG